MKTQDAFQRTLAQTEKKLIKLQNQFDEVKLLYNSGKINEAYEKTIELEETSEKTVLITRVLPIYTGNPKAKTEVENVIRLSIPIEVGFTVEGWFSLRIPALLPKKEKGSKDYIRSYLYLAMKDFFLRKQPVRYNDCVLIYRHVYDRERPERKKRDHDNIELNMVTDIVAMYVMPDDGPEICSHYYCSSDGNTERTEVYIVPKTEFSNWLDKEKNMSDKGVKLYENRLFKAENHM